MLDSVADGSALREGNLAQMYGSCSGGSSRGAAAKDTVSKESFMFLFPGAFSDMRPERFSIQRLVGVFVCRPSGGIRSSGSFSTWLL